MKAFQPVLLAALLFTSFLGIAQKKQLKKANDDFKNYAYIDAIKSYEQLVADGLSESEIYRQLGNANYVNAFYSEAEKWYERLFKLTDKDWDKEYYYRYAQVLKSVGSYEKSDSLMHTFAKKFPEDIRGRKFLNNRQYLKRIREAGKQYAITSVPFNSEASDFAPSFFRNEIVFATARDTGLTSKNVHEWNNSAFLNLYKVGLDSQQQVQNIERLSKHINTKSHESSSVFTKDGLTVYFTRNNFEEGKFKRDASGLSRLKLFRSQYRDGHWQQAEELPFNKAEYSSAHPALSTDEKTLYFSSDMPGTNGMSDIFKVAINADGSFGTPINLGEAINTEGRESFPFIQGDILYFSSDGHPGFGGLDVYAAKLDGSSNQVINLGESINGQQDDFSFIINPSNTGYFASNREGGLGGDDIYAFTQLKPLHFECASVLKGIVKDRETDMPLSNAGIILKSGEEVIQQLSTDAQGNFETEIDCNKEEYTILANREGYIQYAESIVINEGVSSKLVLALPREKILQATRGTDLLKHLGLGPIYFDLDRSELRKDAIQILDEVFKYLMEYPESKIIIHSHADAKGSAEYNKRLSERRAKKTEENLVSRGIAVSRISSKGYGEERLVNNCIVWTNCSSEQNQMNRRSEIIISN